MWRILTHRGLQVILLLSLLAVTVVIRMNDVGGIERLRHATFDYFNKISPRLAGEGVVIVDIDEESIKRMGQWPWPRTEVAKIPERLRALGATAVVFDIVFSEPDRTSPAMVADRLDIHENTDELADQLRDLPDNDDVFAKAIDEAGNVVTAFVWTNQQTDSVPVLKTKFLNSGLGGQPEKFIPSIENFTTTLPKLTAAADGNGSFSMSPEADGLIRRVPLLIGQRRDNGDTRMYPALSLEALRVALDKKFYTVTSYNKPTDKGYGITNIALGDYNIPTDEEGNIWVYYTGHRKDLYIPAWKVISGKVPAERVKDKIVFVGTSAIGLLDMRSTPLNVVVPGVEVHAEITEQILQGRFLSRPSFVEGAEIFAMIGIGLFVIFISPFIGAGSLAMIVMMLIAGGGAGAFYAYQHMGYLVDPVFPALASLVIFILSSILTNLRSEVEKRAVRHAFSHYISPALMSELTSDPDKLKLGGEVRDMSVMFTDIRNFTTISESMDPADLIRMMNDFLTPMTSLVQEHRGTIDKYMGDAMMAFWNAPLDDADHACHACQTAVKMLDALKPVNAELEKRAHENNKPFYELRAGIGIATGACSVGNMGSRQRFAYSALGDTVNLASRLEGQTKAYGVSILITDRTWQAVKGFAGLELDLLTVKGRKEPERIYTLLGEKDVAESDAFQRLKAEHDKMMDAYRTRDFDAAAQYAQSCKSLCMGGIEGFYDLYLARIEVYKKSPPPAGWSGVWVATEK